MSASSKGHGRERAVRRLLTDAGWWTARAAGSLGDADVIALAHGRSLLVEVKATEGGPFETFRIPDRLQLIEAAELCGAEAWLVWWPARRSPFWIPEPLWPADSARGRAALAALQGYTETPRHAHYDPVRRALPLPKAKPRVTAQLPGQLQLPI